MEKKSGYLAIVGPTNAGKSTLLNKIVGVRIASVSHKVQTTNVCLSGIAHRGDVEFILLDTPGLFVAEKKTRNQAHIMRNISYAIEQADYVLILLDGTQDVNAAAIKRVVRDDKKFFLALNKVDAIQEKSTLLEKIAAYNALEVFDEIFLISALRNFGLEEMLSCIAGYFEERPWCFTQEDMTLLTQRELATEMMRGVIFQRFNKELPYTTEVEVVHWEDKPDYASVMMKVFVEAPTHRGILVGHQGEGVKYIREKTQHRLTAIVGRDVRVSVDVMVRKK